MKRWKFKNKKRIKQVQPVVLVAHVYLQRTDEPHAWLKDKTKAKSKQIEKFNSSHAT